MSFSLENEFREQRLKVFLNFKSRIPILNAGKCGECDSKSGKETDRNSGYAEALIQNFLNQTRTLDIVYINRHTYRQFVQKAACCS